MPHRERSNRIRFGDQSLSAIKQNTTETHRTCTPAETFERFRPFMPAMGITRVANITGLDHLGVHVYTAIRPNSRSLATSQGKGLDRSAARTSALMESIEMFHAEFITSPLWNDTPAQMARRGAVIDVARLPRRPGVELNPRYTRNWIAGYDLSRQQSVYVPFEAVALSRTGSRGANPWVAGTTGLASGNHLLEAITHALCEIIERDAVRLWRESRAARKLDLTTIDDPACRQLIEQIERAGLHLTLHVLPTDIDVTVLVCDLVPRPDSARWEQVFYAQGYGCHLSPRIALIRAVTEAAQSRLTSIAGNRDDVSFRAYDWHRTVGIDDAQWAEIARPGAADFRHQRDLSTPAFEQDVALLLERLRTVGLDSVVVVDLTRPEFGIPVVKVLVPNTETSFGAPGARVRAAIGAT